MIKKILPIVVVVVFIGIMLSRVGIGMVGIVHSPKTDLYFQGIIYGSQNEIDDTDYVCIFYDAQLNELRREDVKVYLKKKFVINYEKTDRYVKFVAPFKPVKKVELEYFQVTLFEPDGLLDLSMLKGKVVGFSLNRFVVVPEAVLLKQKADEAKKK